jgi:hypothetical protein
MLLPFFDAARMQSAATAFCARERRPKPPLPLPLTCLAANLRHKHATLLWRSSHTGNQASSLWFLTSSRPSSVRQTLWLPSMSSHPRATAHSSACLVASFSSLGNDHQRSSPSVAWYRARTRCRANVSAGSAMSHLRRRPPKGSSRLTSPGEQNRRQAGKFDSGIDLEAAGSRGLPKARNAPVSQILTLAAYWCVTPCV